MKRLQLAMLLAPYSEYARAVQNRRAVLPGTAAGAHEHGEDLLAGPQLQRLEQRRLRQLHGIQRVAHLRDELPNLPAAEEAVLACEQEAGCQEVLQSQAQTIIADVFAAHVQSVAYPAAGLVVQVLSTGTRWSQLGMSFPCSAEVWIC